MGQFAFKEFTIAQDRCAQKIGTDGVLLGAWASVASTPYAILDVGTGTGVIALMLAQRFSRAQVDAMELDIDAHAQATENFEDSSWCDRMFCYHASFQEFYEELEGRYDFIVSNPPFYDSTSLKDTDQVAATRQQARFDDALPFEELIYGVYKLLEPDGTFCCIIPYEREVRFLEIAAHYQLLPTRITHVKGTDSSAIKRSLLQLQFDFRDNLTARRPALIDCLVIEYARHKYTNEYQELVKDFYLKM